MRRAPLVITGTACGLVAVIGYHAAVPQASALTSASGSTGTGSLQVGGPSSTTSSSSRSATASAASGSTTASSATAGSGVLATRSAVGSDVQYPYGDVEVKVTMTGAKVTNVTLQRHDVTDPRSQQIDAYVLPILRTQALTAQSAKLDGVSGASYTSAAYEQSLQSALDKLKA